MTFYKAENSPSNDFWALILQTFCIVILFVTVADSSSSSSWTIELEGMTSPGASPVLPDVESSINWYLKFDEKNKNFLWVDPSVVI